MDLGIKDKVAVVAGGSRGCGFGIAMELAREGARVLLSGRNSDAVVSAVSAITAAGGTAQGVVADMTDKPGADSIIAAARDHFGPVAILVVNSPGPVPDPHTGHWRGFDNCSDEDFEAVHRDFVMSLVYLARPALADMKSAGWGRLANIGSIAMKVPHLEDPMPASNTRVAVNGLMKTLSQEYGAFGITANTIATGPFESELSRSYRQSGTGIKTAEWYQKMLPVGRWGQPEEMGALVAFLCSTRAAFLTGETIRLDGGYTKSLF
ncbi:MAG: SDR family oxidoreductase [Sphingorhabdus sp.]